MQANGRWDLIRRLKVKGKGKVFPVHVMKLQGLIQLHIHSFWTSVLNGSQCLPSHPGLVTPGKKPRYPLNGKSRFGRFGEAKELLPLSDSRHGPPSLVVMPITLSEVAKFVVLFKWTWCLKWLTILIMIINTAAVTSVDRQGSVCYSFCTGN